jgi:hypothetical protein
LLTLNHLSALAAASAKPKSAPPLFGFPNRHGQLAEFLNLAAKLGFVGGLQAIDYGKVRSGQGGSGSHLPPGGIAAQRRADYRAAMPEKCRKVVELILLQDQDLTSAGKAASGSAVSEKIIASPPCPCHRK